MVGSPAAAGAVEGTFGVPRSRLHHLHDLLPSTELWHGAPAGEVRAERTRRTRARLAERYGIPADAPLIATRDRIDHMAVTDLFAQVAWTVQERAPELGIHWLWLGDGASGRMLWPLRHDISHAGLAGCVHIHQGRRDPPPLECLAASAAELRSNLEPVDREVALHSEGVGSISFGILPSGGWPTEIAGPRRTSPWLDVDHLADEAVALIRSPGILDELGRPAEDEPTSWDPAVGGPMLLDLLAAAARR